MADFRRCILALAVIALLTGLVTTASAQVPFSCNNSAVPFAMRGEGQAELVGDIILNCGTPGGVIPAPGTVAQVSVFLGGAVQVTNRLLNSSNLTDALLLVDEQSLGACWAAITGEATSPACTGQTGTPVSTVIQGTVIGNQVFFSNVPINPPGTTGTISYRITNIRANATAISPAAGLSPVQLLANVTITTNQAPFSIPVNNSQLTVGYVQRGLTFGVYPVTAATSSGKGTIPSSASTSALTFAQCQTIPDKSVPQAVLRFSENFPTAFKIRGVLGNTTNTESGTMLTGLSTTGGGVLNTPVQNLGQADFGTRVKAVFNNIPTGVSIYVSTTNTTAGVAGSAGITASLIISETAADSGPAVPSQPATDALGDITSVPGSNNKLIGAYMLTPVGGSATAVWEVTGGTNPGLPLDNLDFLVYFNYTANTASNLPQPGVIGTVNGSFAPISTVVTASSTAPVPRFADTSTAINLLTIAVCRTNLLFPFVTASSGFDTGLAIANTTKDIFGTVAQAGTCTLNFYPATIPGGTTQFPTVAPVTSSVVNAGDSYITLTSTVAPGFEGYIIAQCQFQYAHGFAFVQNSAPGLSAMGYLALVIPDGTARKIPAISIGSVNTGELLGQ